MRESGADGMLLGRVVQLLHRRLVVSNGMGLTLCVRVGGHVSLKAAAREGHVGNALKLRWWHLLLLVLFLFLCLYTAFTSLLARAHLTALPPPRKMELLAVLLGFLWGQALCRQRELLQRQILVTKLIQGTVELLLQRRITLARLRLFGRARLIKL